MAAYGKSFRDRDHVNAAILRGMDGNRQSVQAIRERLNYLHMELELARTEFNTALDEEHHGRMLDATSRMGRAQGEINALTWVLGTTER